MVGVILLVVSLLAAILVLVAPTNRLAWGNAFLMLGVGVLVTLWTFAIGSNASTETTTITAQRPLVQIDGHYLTEDRYVIFEQDGRQRTLELPSDATVLPESDRAELVEVVTSRDMTWFLPNLYIDKPAKYIVRVP